MNDLQPADVDERHLAALRDNVTRFTERVAREYMRPGDRVLDVAPQVHHGVSPFVKDGVIVETLDIDPNANTTYVGDICRENICLPASSFNHIVCTEVLEHTMHPFDAVDEMWRILRPQGYLFISVPFDFRIHGPLPDCWRFTEHGLRSLLARFEILDINALENPKRPLMPIHYTAIALKAP